MTVFCVCVADLTLKEEANKKAYENFAKEKDSHGAANVTSEVSERYESEYFLTLIISMICALLDGHFCEA